jgi:AcrR family transcriptional regulator
VRPVSERGSTTLDLVLNTSTELFAERGFAAATMRELAERADLQLSSFYYYFRSKYDVLLAIMDSAMGRLEDGAADVFDERLGPEAQLHALVARHVQSHLINPAAAGVADAELRALEPDDRAEMVGRRDRYEKRFREVIAEGVEEGCFDSELDVKIAVIAILTMSTGVIDWWKPAGALTVEATAQLIGDFALALARGPAR